MISRHGAIYAAEFGWDGTFEVLVAEIAAGIMKKFDRGARGRLDRRAGRRARGQRVPGARERRGGEAAAAAGGAGRCAAWASARAWWTNARGSRGRPDTSASRCGPIRCWSRRGGSTRMPATAWCSSEPYCGFGQDLVSETWELELG